MHNSSQGILIVWYVVSMTNLRLLQEKSNLEINQEFQEYKQNLLELSDPSKYREYCGYGKQKLTVRASQLKTQKFQSKRRTIQLRANQ